jgi:hypothetical protein
MLDALLDWSVVFLPTILSLVGVLVSLKAPLSKYHKAWRFSLVAVGITVSAVTFWQQSRSRTAHANEINGLNGKMLGISSKTDALTRETQRLRREAQAEIARR